MKIRFFGSSNCEDCLNLFVIINKAQIDYDYIDALDEREDVQDFCEENNVYQLPHIQFVENNEVVVEHIGPMDENVFIEYLSNYFPDY